MTFAAAALGAYGLKEYPLVPGRCRKGKMPAVGLSTGRSLGWASVKKSFVSMEAVSMVARGRADLSGSMAAARTTISASMCSCRPPSRSDAWTFSACRPGGLLSYHALDIVDAYSSTARR